MKNTFREGCTTIIAVAIIFAIMFSIGAAFTAVLHFTADLPFTFVNVAAFSFSVGLIVTMAFDSLTGLVNKVLDLLER